MQDACHKNFVIDLELQTVGFSAINIVCLVWIYFVEEYTVYTLDYFIHTKRNYVVIYIFPKHCFSLSCSHPSSSAVTCTILGFCCWSFFISSKPNSSKENETAPSIFIKLTSLQSMPPARKPKSNVKDHCLSLHLSFPNFQEHWMAHTEKDLGIFFWFIICPLD